MRVLIISPAAPWPARRGYQLRAAHWAESLARRHAVTVVAQHEPGAAVAPPPKGVGLQLVPHGLGARVLGASSLARRPGQVALHRQGALRRAVAAAVVSQRPDVAVLVLSRQADVVPALDGVPLVVDFVDALALNMTRRAARQPLLAPLWRWEARRMAAWDQRLLTVARAATVVAERDRASLLEHGASEPGAASVHVVPLGMAIPAASRPPPPGPPMVVLTGNLGYFPTVDGASWFAQHVWPRVRREQPTARWCLAGARPASTLRRLAGSHGIEVVADPPDLGVIRGRAHLAIAPLRAGSGTPIKILEAMAEGVPVVTTESGVAGLDDLPADALAVAASADDMGRKLVELLATPERAEAQAARARAWLTERHDWHAVGRRFESILKSVAAGQSSEP